MADLPRDEDESERYEPDLTAHRSWLRRRARSHLGAGLRRVLDSEDLTQEAELRALRHLDGKRFPNARAFRGWLRAILRNVAAQKARRIGAAASGVEPDGVAGRERSPSSAARAAEEDLRLRALLRRLPERERNVVALRLIEELSFREVAERVGTSEPYARMIFSRSIRRLREAAGEPDAGSR